MYIPKDKVREIVNNRPQGTNPEEVIKQLVSNGHELEGFSTSQAPTAQTAPIAPTAPVATTAQPQAEPESQGFFSGAFDKMKKAAASGVEMIGKAGGAGVESDIYNPAERAIRGAVGAGRVLTSPIAGVIGQGLEEGIKAIPQETRAQIAETAKPTVESVKNWYESQTPEEKKLLENVGLSTELLFGFIGAGQADDAIKMLTNVTKRVPGKAEELASALGTKVQDVSQPKGLKISFGEDVTETPYVPTAPKAPKTAVDPGLEQARETYMSMARVGVGKKTAPQLQARYDKGFAGAQQAARTGKLTGNIETDFEEVVPSIQREVFKSYDDIAKSKGETVNDNFQNAVSTAEKRFADEYGEGALAAVRNDIAEARRNFGGSFDAEGNQIPLYMTQSQNVIKAINKEMGSFYQSGGATGGLGQEFKAILLDEARKTADDLLGTRYGELRSDYGALKEFTEQLKNVYVKSIKSGDKTNSERYFDVLNNAGMAFDIVMAMKGNPTAGFWGVVGAAKKISDYMNRNKYSKLVKQLSPKKKSPYDQEYSSGNIEGTYVPPLRGELVERDYSPANVRQRTRDGVRYWQPGRIEAGTQRGNTPELPVGSEQARLPAGQAPRALPLPRTPKGATYPRTDVSAESLRGIGKVGTMDTRSARAKFSERMRNLKRPVNPDALPAVLNQQNPLAYTKSVKPLSLSEIASNRYEDLAEAQIAGKSAREGIANLRYERFKKKHGDEIDKANLEMAIEDGYKTPEALKEQLKTRKGVSDYLDEKYNGNYVSDFAKLVAQLPEKVREKILNNPEGFNFSDLRTKDLLSSGAIKRLTNDKRVIARMEKGPMFDMAAATETMPQGMKEGISGNDIIEDVRLYISAEKKPNAVKRAVSKKKTETAPESKEVPKPTVQPETARKSVQNEVTETNPLTGNKISIENEASKYKDGIQFFNEKLSGVDVSEKSLLSLGISEGSIKRSISGGRIDLEEIFSELKNKRKNESGIAYPTIREGETSTKLEKQKANYEAVTKPESKPETPKSNVSVEDYGNGIIVKGDTYSVKEYLKEAGGKWNRTLGGWVFPKSKEADVKIALSKETHSAKPQTESAKPKPATETKQNEAKITDVVKLRKQAQEWRAKAEETRDAQRNENTSRRAAMADSQRERANMNVRLANVMEAYADRVESGEKMKFSISSKADVERMERMKNVYDYKREKGQSYDPYVSYVRIYNSDLDSITPAYKAKATKAGVSDIRESLYRIRDSAFDFSSDSNTAKALRFYAENPPEGVSKWSVQTILDNFKEAQATKRILGDSKIDDAVSEYKKLSEAGKVTESPEMALKRKERDLVMNTKIEGFFPTPEKLVDEMVEEAGITKGMRVLEPSAGIGSIADKAKALGAEVDVLEISPTLRSHLEEKGYSVAGNDFMELPTSQKYDRILMNPPFERLQDAEHVMKAYEHLAPGGKLVAITSESPFFSSIKKAEEFRDWLESVGGTSRKNPEGSFKDALRSTGVNTRTVIVEKPKTAPEKVAKQAETDTVPEVKTNGGKVTISNGEIGYVKKPLSEKILSKISDKDSFIKGIRDLNQRYIDKYGIEKFDEQAELAYEKEVISYISKGYEVPDSILKTNPKFSSAVDKRARYEKGLYTSFSNKDVRINQTTKELIGGGVKRQDGKEITPEQVREIVEGVSKTSKVLGIDIKRLAEGENIVFVHLNGKNPFLTSGTVSGLHRKSGDQVSLSVGGTESAKETVHGKSISSKVETTMAHELGHALDYMPGERLSHTLAGIPGSGRYNPVDGLFKYFRKPEERVARMIDQYVGIKSGDTSYYSRPGFWEKELFDKMEIEIESALKRKFKDYLIGGDNK